MCRPFLAFALVTGICDMTSLVYFSDYAGFGQDPIPLAYRSIFAW